jgi:O-methyltransferase involved in polyketide biosynthesis
MDRLRDFTSVSPSARWMILWKGYTEIPFARKIAELLEAPNPYAPNFKKKDFTFWASTVALERRYRSIDRLVNELDIPNILELSSGFSFRGLDFVQKKGVHYIDTDLPDVIVTKKELYRQLNETEQHICATLEFLPLNVLDESAFNEVVGHFPSGEVLIVNEGLLTYLNKSEKEALCSIIHRILMERGGFWITADILIKDKESKLGLTFSEEIKDFNVAQKIDANSFNDFKETEQFFKDMGFVVEKEAEMKYSEMSAFKYLIKSMTFKQLFKVKSAGKVQATWCLKAV